MLRCLVPVIFAFYIQGVLKFKCKVPAPKGLFCDIHFSHYSLKPSFRRVKHPGGFKMGKPWWLDIIERLMCDFVYLIYSVCIKVLLR